MLLRMLAFFVSSTLIFGKWDAEFLDNPYAPTCHPYVATSATAYYIHGTTASGEQTRYGICAGPSEWMGCTIVVWQRLPDGSVGELIGYYECLDTGGPGVQSGVVDIWRPDLDECQDFMNRVYEDDCQGKVYVQVIKAVG